MEYSTPTLTIEKFDICENIAEDEISAAVFNPSFEENDGEYSPIHDVVNEIFSPLTKN